MTPHLATPHLATPHLAAPHLATPHLTTEELEQALTLPTPRSADHLRLCAPCTRNLDELHRMLGSLRFASTAVAANQHSIAKAAIARPARRVPRSALTFATAAVLLAAAVPVTSRLRPHSNPIITPHAASQSLGTLSDEALLNSVRNDLSSSTLDTLQPLSASTSAGQTQSQTQVRND